MCVFLKNSSVGIGDSFIGPHLNLKCKLEYNIYVSALLWKNYDSLHQIIPLPFIVDKSFPHSYLPNLFGCPPKT